MKPSQTSYLSSMFKVSNKDTRTTPMTDLICDCYCLMYMALDDYQICDTYFGFSKRGGY